MICSYDEYIQTQQATIQLLIQDLSLPGRPVTTANFEPAFLKSFYIQNAPILENHVLTCYERLLNFWIEKRIEALKAEYELHQGNINYENFLKNRSPLDRIGDFIAEMFKNWEISLTVISAIGILYLIKK